MSSNGEPEKPDKPGEEAGALPPDLGGIDQLSDNVNLLSEPARCTAVGEALFG